MMTIEKLAAQYPWPDKKPDVDPQDFGWFEPCAERLLSQYIGKDTKMVVELGSWLGKSTRWFLKQAPAATVIAIDHWQGSREHSRFGDEFLKSIYDQFIQNCWDYRDRLIPIRETTLVGLALCGGLSPDLVYVDASHDAKSVRADIMCAMSVFPDALITGDDYTWGPQHKYPVRQAVDSVCCDHGFKLEVDEATWALHR